jgi:hypothetical protein
MNHLVNLWINFALWPVPSQFFLSYHIKIIKNLNLLMLFNIFYFLIKNYYFNIIINKTKKGHGSKLAEKLTEGLISNLRHTYTV